jgi:DNA repair protein RadC
MIKAAKVKLIYVTKVKAADRPLIENSRDAYELFKSDWDMDTIEYYESCKIMLLNSANRVLGIADLSSGGITSSIIDVRKVFQPALLANATNVILAHNHPSGNLKPSEADIEITRKIRHAGKFLDIQVHDHIIVTAEGYRSLSDEGLI